MKFLLFGTGEYYNRYRIWFEKQEIVALVDNAKTKQGRYIDGIRVISPDEICRYDFDIIVIMSFYVREMKDQLVELGIEKDKIHHFYDLHDLVYSPSKRKKIHCYGTLLPTKGNARKVLLLSQDLTLGGPALALFHAAQIFIKNGFQTVYASMLDGSLKEILLKEGIPVVVDENLLVSTMMEADWIKGYDLMICNTVNFHVFLSERKVDVPVVWWLHDSLFFYDGVNQKAMQGISGENMRIWTVGPVAENAIKAFRPDFDTEDLLYGVEDMGSCRFSQSMEKVRFAIIGYIEPRKGQDILLQSVMELAPDVRRMAEFYIIGQNTSVMAAEIMEAAKEIPEIIFTGPVGRKEINHILDKSDMLVCPSREDPMPTVAAEAMMHGVPCLVSDATGTAAYIKDGVDGLVFRSEDADELARKITWCIVHRQELAGMGVRARKIYEARFSMEVFEKNLLSVVEESL